MNRLLMALGALVSAIAVSTVPTALPAQAVPIAATVPGQTLRTLAATAAACTSTPFTSQAAAKTWYRIPAIVRTGSGAIVAFAERRDNDSTTDRGNYDIVARTSTDRGCTWGPLTVVADLGSNHLSSPVPLWDPTTSSLLLFSSLRDTHDVYQGLYLQRSSDDGATWSPLSQGRITVTNPARWKGGLQGPGHGLVLTHGPAAGRLIFAMGYKKSGHYGTYALYSDDGGASWQVGFDRAAPGKLQLIEGTIAELPDGRLLVSYRDKRKTKPGTNRVFAISTDAGATLSTYRTRPGVKTMAVEASLLQTSGGPMLLSAPSFIKTKNLSIRKDMRIFISTNGGSSWRKGPLIGGKARPSAYSDLVELDAASVGLLYETGKRSWRERIAFVQVPRSALG
jgi:sialidase-1